MLKHLLIAFVIAAASAAEAQTATATSPGTATASDTAAPSGDAGAPPSADAGNGAGSNGKGTSAGAAAATGKAENGESPTKGSSGGAASSGKINASTSNGKGNGSASSGKANASTSNLKGNGSTSNGKANASTSNSKGNGSASVKGNGTANGKGTPSEIRVARFSAYDLSGWDDKAIKGKTVYSFVDGALKAHAVKAASGKIKQLSVDARKFPRITWSWKIDHTLKREDIKKKSGDDFAARVYVLFPRTFFWRLRAINYVWASKMPKGSEAFSPYTNNSIIIAVESGDEKSGKWVTEERNVYEDYKRVYGEEPPLMGGVAILTDTDDTQEEATAWYGDITLRAAP